LGAALCPYSAAAQTANKRPVLGILLSAPEQRKSLRLAQSFFNGLRDLGYVQNRDFDIVSRLAASTSDLDKAAEELVRLNPNVILAGASANALALKKATSTIPIVVAALGNTLAYRVAPPAGRRPTSFAAQPRWHE
jgi:putative ABC transport system substrate-binding protein